MTKRKAITERMKISAIFYRYDIDCAWCEQSFCSFDQIEWDHINPIIFDGEHDYTNIRPLHKACHREKTSGTKATTAGSDIHAIAKAKRIAKGGKKRKGRAIKSRGFDKTRTRKFDGTIISRK